MTLTELLESVRRVEVRTNRLVNGSAGDFLGQASAAQFRRIPGAVENSQDSKRPLFEGKVDGVFLKAARRILCARPRMR